MVKKYIETESSNSQEESGYSQLIGETITVYTCRYIYHGKLIEEGEDYIKLLNPAIIYETGSYEDKNFADKQSLHTETWNIAKQSVESFGILNKS